MIGQATPSPAALWQSFLQAVQGKLSAQVWRTWLRPVHCSAFDGRLATLEVRDQFFRDWMADHYLDFIRNGLSDVARTPVEIQWVVNPALAEQPSDADEADEDEDEDGGDEPLDEDDVDGDGDAHDTDRAADAPANRDDSGGRRAAKNGSSRPTHGRKAASASTPAPDEHGEAAAAVTSPSGRLAPRASKRTTEAAPRGTGRRSAAGSGTTSSKRQAGRSGRAGKGSQEDKLGHELAGDGKGDFGEETRQLNKRYVFENFVQGPSNQFAFAACHAAAQNPGRSYNPLFIYGGVGLGKTHLLSAIGHHILANKKDAQIIYVSSEQFTNEVIKAVLSGRLAEFRAKYLTHGDAILVDDIQLIAGKERTQHEFFHIFNSMYDSQRQIVVTSDKLPHEIPDIEERLRNRFQWGLIADVQPPEIETRIAILRKKAEVEHFELANDVAFFLARSIRSNVRELEGALVRIMAHASLTQTPVTIEYARTALNDILQHVPSEVSIESIQKTVANYFSIRVSELKGARRQKALVRARQIAMYLCRKHLGCSYPELGSRFGNKDHTTVLASCSRVIAALNTDVNMRMQLDEIEQRINFEAQQ